MHFPSRKVSYQVQTCSTFGEDPLVPLSTDIDKSRRNIPAKLKLPATCIVATKIFQHLAALTQLDSKQTKSRFIKITFQFKFIVIKLTAYILSQMSSIWRSQRSDMCKLIESIFLHIPFHKSGLQIHMMKVIYYASKYRLKIKTTKKLPC